MANDRTKDRTETVGVQMNDGASRGELTAPESRRQMTVAQERAHARDNMLADVANNKAEIIKFLAAFGIDFDVFEAGLKVFLMRQMQTQPDFFTSVTQVSFMEALFRIAMNGLIPDGKEAAIGHFKGAATAMFMRDGLVKVLWRTGMIKSINDDVVTRPEYEQGRFKYRAGDNGFIEHEPDLERKDTDETMAAWCVVELVTGGVIREVVVKADLDKIAKSSKSPARASWKFQMDRKAAIRRIMGKMPREKGIAQILAHDDLNYDLKLVGSAAGDQRALPTESLFSNKVAAPKKKAAPAIEASEPVVEAEVVDLEAEEPSVDSNAMAGAFVTEVLHAESMDALADLKARIAETQGLAAEDLDWIDEEIIKKMASFAPEESGPQPLRALLTSAAGVVVYDDADLWRDDILNKMSAIKGDPLKAFWKHNEQFILDARADHPAQAKRILQTAVLVRLIKDLPDE